MMLSDSIIGNLDEAILLFDRRERLLFMNKAAEELLGRSFREIGDKHCSEIFGGSRDISLLIGKTLAEGRSFNWRDKELETDVAGILSVDLHACPHYADNSLDGAILCLRENLALTDREDLQFDSLLYLIGSIAHEIKNPLSGIRGAAQILGRSARDAEAQECVDLLLRETDRLNAVLNSYLTMTRRPVFHDVNIHEVIEHALKVTEFPLKGKTVRITKSYDPSLPNIRGDESKLLQVFINLLKNALEAVEGARKKEVSVSTRLSNEYMVIYEGTEADRKPPKGKKQRWVVVTVQDSGKGIPRDEMKRVFLPFYTMKAGGSGLGLALSKKIVKDHGGLIRVKSERGMGATFSVCLPLQK